MEGKHDLACLNGTGLSESADGKLIVGQIRIDATYNEGATEPFVIIAPDDSREFSGVRLSGTFNISIDLEGFPSGLPKLVLFDDIPKEARRHFYTDVNERLACVCGPGEELRFMQQYNLKDYIELYVIPFLYGQLYFDKEGKWPWKEYSHNTEGILESYVRTDGTPFLQDFISKLIARKNDWPRLEVILLSKKSPKGHIMCFCPAKTEMRKCHPEALEGLKKIYEDVRNIRLK